MSPPTRVCITGANAGVGYEAARQLALQPGVQKVILACRNPSKAQAAKESLEQSTGKTNCFEILILDVSNLASVQKAVDMLQGEIDCLILNAGGFVGKQPTAQTDHGTMKIFDLNVLGHVYFTDLLLKEGKLKEGHVLYVSSETSRGARTLCSQHQFKENGSLDEMKSLCDGTCFKKEPKELDVYGRVKLMGDFWAGHMARQYPNIRFIAVSPGNTAGTNVVNHMKLPQFIKTIGNQIALPLMVWTGRFHPLQVGAQRYLDVIYDEGTYQTGHFYASKSSWPTGPMADQSKHCDYLYKSTYQDNANAAIHSFLPKV